MTWPSVLMAAAPAIVLALALMIVERWRGRDPADYRRNLQNWALQIVVGLTLLTVVSLPVRWSLLDGHRLPLWLGFIVFLIVRDFFEYLFHRAQHRIPFLWAMHSLHHSDPDMQALTTQRHFWGDVLVKNLTIWPATCVIIAPTAPILSGFAAVMLWNFVVHSNLRIDFGRWSWLVNSPAYHRRHHSKLPEHYDSNFAALFPIFDVAFGCYHRPSGFPETGLEHKPESFAALLVWPLIWDRPPLAKASPGAPALRPHGS